MYCGEKSVLSIPGIAKDDMRYCEMSCLSVVVHTSESGDEMLVDVSGKHN